MADMKADDGETKGISSGQQDLSADETTLEKEEGEITSDSDSEKAEQSPNSLSGSNTKHKSGSPRHSRKKHDREHQDGSGRDKYYSEVNPLQFRRSAPVRLNVSNREMFYPSMINPHPMQIVDQDYLRQNNDAEDDEYTVMLREVKQQTRLDSALEEKRKLKSELKSTRSNPIESNQSESDSVDPLDDLKLLRLQAIDSVIKGSCTTYKSSSRKNAAVSRSSSKSYTKRHSSRSASDDCSPKFNEQDSLYEAALGVDKRTRKERCTALSKTVSAEDSVKVPFEVQRSPMSSDRTNIQDNSSRQNISMPPDLSISKRGQLTDTGNRVFNSTTLASEAEQPEVPPTPIPLSSAGLTSLNQTNVTVQDADPAPNINIQTPLNPIVPSKSETNTENISSVESMDIVNSDSDNDTELVQFIRAKQDTKSENYSLQPDRGIEPTTMPAADRNKVSTAVPSTDRDEKASVTQTAVRDRDVTTTPAANEEKEPSSVPAAARCKESSIAPVLSRQSDEPTTTQTAVRSKEPTLMPSAEREKVSYTVSAAGSATKKNQNVSEVIDLTIENDEIIPKPNNYVAQLKPVPTISGGKPTYPIAVSSQNKLSEFNYPGTEKLKGAVLKESPAGKTTAGFGAFTASPFKTVTSEVSELPSPFAANPASLPSKKKSKKKKNANQQPYSILSLAPNDSLNMIIREGVYSFMKARKPIAVMNRSELNTEKKHMERIINQSAGLLNKTGIKKKRKKTRRLQQLQYFFTLVNQEISQRENPTNTVTSPALLAAYPQLPATLSSYHRAFNPLQAVTPVQKALRTLAQPASSESAALTPSLAATEKKSPLVRLSNTSKKDVQPIQTGSYATNMVHESFITRPRPDVHKNASQSTADMKQVVNNSMHDLVSNAPKVSDPATKVTAAVAMPSTSAAKPSTSLIYSSQLTTNFSKSSTKSSAASSANGEAAGLIASKIASESGKKSSPTPSNTHHRLSKSEKKSKVSQESSKKLSKISKPEGVTPASTGHQSSSAVKGKTTPAKTALKDPDISQTQHSLEEDAEKNLTGVLAEVSKLKAASIISTTSKELFQSKDTAEPARTLISTKGKYSANASVTVATTTPVASQRVPTPPAIKPASRTPKSRRSSRDSQDSSHSANSESHKKPKKLVSGSRIGRGSVMDVLVIPDPDEQYKAFMSKMGSKHTKIYTTSDLAMTSLVPVTVTASGALGKEDMCTVVSATSYQTPNTTASHVRASAMDVDESDAEALRKAALKSLALKSAKRKAESSISSVTKKRAVSAISDSKPSDSSQLQLSAGVSDTGNSVKAVVLSKKDLQASAARAAEASNTGRQTPTAPRADVNSPARPITVSSDMDTSQDNSLSPVTSSTAAVLPSRSRKVVSARHRAVTRPIVKPLIINLRADDSSEDEMIDETVPLSNLTKSSSSSALSGLDSFLKEARKDAEKIKPTVKRKGIELTSPNTQETVRILPPDKQATYLSLKRRMDALMKKKEKEQKAKAAVKSSETKSSAAAVEDASDPSPMSEVERSKSPAIRASAPGASSEKEITTSATTITTTTTTASCTVPASTDTTPAVTSVSTTVSITKQSTTEIPVTTTAALPLETVPTISRSSNVPSSSDTELSQNQIVAKTETKGVIMPTATSSESLALARLPLDEDDQEIDDTEKLVRRTNLRIEKLQKELEQQILNLKKAKGKLLKLKKAREEKRKASVGSRHSMTHCILRKREGNMSHRKLDKDTLGSASTQRQTSKFASPAVFDVPYVFKSAADKDSSNTYQVFGQLGKTKESQIAAVTENSAQKQMCDPGDDTVLATEKVLNVENQQKSVPSSAAKTASSIVLSAPNPSHAEKWKTLESAQESYDPSSTKKSTDRTKYQPTPLAVRKSVTKNEYEPEPVSRAETKVPEYHPTSVTAPRLPDSGTQPDPHNQAAWALENQKRLKALERAMNIKLRQKYMQKMQPSDESVSGAAKVPGDTRLGLSSAGRFQAAVPVSSDIISLPEVDESSASPVIKRRRSALGSASNDSIRGSKLSYREKPQDDTADSDSHTDDTDGAEDGEMKVAPSKAVMSFACTELIKSTTDLKSEIQTLLSMTAPEPCMSGRRFAEQLFSDPSMLTSQQSQSKPLVTSKLFNKLQNMEKYSSILKLFSSYKLNPSMREKEKVKLASPSFNHNLDPRKFLCKYDLHGKCSDPSCKLQHERDYKQGLEGCIASMRAMTTQRFPDSVPEFIKSCRNRLNPLTDDQILIYAATQVCSSLKATPPHTIQFDSPEVTRAEADLLESASTSGVTSNSSKSEHGNSSEQTTAPDNGLQSTKAGKKTSFQSKKFLSNKERREPLDDNVIFGSDVRYYMDPSSSVPDMEEAVLENPQDTRLWMKLAYKKLQETKNQPQGIREALHVTSLALENNQSDHDLWLLYLKLYKRQKPSERKDYSELCEKVLVKQASYDIFMQYVESLNSVAKKLEALNHVAVFITRSNKLSTDQKSFAVLQNLLVRTQYMISANFKRIQDPLTNALDSESSEFSLLTTEDRTLAGLYLAYITLHQSLPRNLLHNGVTLMGRTPPYLNWDKPAKLSETEIHQRRSEARQILFKTYQMSCNDPLNSPAHWELRNAICKLEDGTVDSLVSLVHNWYGVQSSAPLEELELLYLQTNLEHGKVRPSQFTKMCKDTLEKLPHSCKCYYKIAVWGADGPNEGMNCLEPLVSWAYSMFDQPIPDYIDVKVLQNTDLFYRTILGLSIPQNYPMAPKLNTDRLGQYSTNMLYAWLCFIFLMKQLPSATSADIKEVYETAICQLTEKTDVEQMTSEYILYMRSEALDDSRKASGFISSVERFISVSPIAFKNCLGESYTDYTFHNKIIQLVSEVVHMSDVSKWLEICLKKHPDNLDLVLRLCEHYLIHRKTDLASARHVCEVLADLNLGDEVLWYMYIKFSIRSKKFREALTLSQRALRILPYSSNIWSQCILLMHGLALPVKAVEDTIEACRKSDVNLEEFMAGLPKKKDTD